MTLASDLSLNQDETRALEEATRWLLRTRQTLQPDERAEFLRWMQASPENAAAMDAVFNSWEISGVTARTSALRFDLLRARRLSLWGRAEEHRRSRRANNVRTRVLRAALVTAVCAVCIALAWSFSSVNRVYSTGRGDQLSMSLSDGTRVRLDASSRVEVHLDPLRRRVRLVHGEAEFQVGRDLWRSFRLDAGDIEVKDLGTRFTVRQRNGTLRVVLIEGKVELVDTTAGTLLTDLAPGQQAVIARGRQLSVIPADMTAVLAWQQGRLVLKDTPLGEAIDELRERAPVDITLSSPALRELRISGMYDAKNVAGFIDAVCTLYSLSCRKDAAQSFEISGAVGSSR